MSSRGAALWLSLLSAIGAVVGCSAGVRRCEPGTLLVAVTLPAVAAAADTLDVGVSLDGNPPISTRLTHAGGAVVGNIVVQFPSGYPHGDAVTIVVTALGNNVPLASGQQTVSLDAGCEAVTLTLTAAAPDLGVADLATMDAAVDAATDAAARDLLPADLRGVDLRSAPDLACAAKSETDCFNGVDDDCDGLIDCDDPDCAPVAVCVPPIAAEFTYGTTVPSAQPCPSPFGAPTDLSQGLTAATPACVGCSCSGTTNCFGAIYTYEDAEDCNEDNNAGILCLPSQTCHTTNAIPASQFAGVRADGASIGTTTCAKTGTAAPSAVSWASDLRFCPSTARGGGCSGGQLCVPKTAPRCELADNTPFCDNDYIEDPHQWYTAYADERSCTCACTTAPSGGSCSPSITLYTDVNCTMGALSVGAGADCGGNFIGYLSAQIASVPPDCGSPGYTPGAGTLSPTGQKTLCCVP